MKSKPRFCFLLAAVSLAVLMVVGFANIRLGAAEQAASELLQSARLYFEVLPDKMPGSENDTPAQVQLGKKLYDEKNISINRTQNCNSCHRVDENLGGVDYIATAQGAKGEFGHRNAPTVLNAGFQIAQFWDGRAASLEEQAEGPVLADVEMGMLEESAVIKRLKEAGYTKLFQTAFPAADDPMTFKNYATAIAAFERTLVTHDRFDDFLEGDEEALTAREKKGLAQFMEIGCADCHSGKLLGGNRFEKMGDANPYANTEDIGRMAVTRKEKDKFVFKVPILRNVAITNPYFHDGKAKTLADAVEQMAYLQLDEELSDQQVGEIVAFLGALTDKNRVGKKSE
jgi:cytochrome c peroxidase